MIISIHFKKYINQLITLKNLNNKNLNIRENRNTQLQISNFNYNFRIFINSHYCVNLEITKLNRFTINEFNFLNSLKIEYKHEYNQYESVYNFIYIFNIKYINIIKIINEFI